jgi:hypothetical protein
MRRRTPCHSRETRQIGRPTDIPMRVVPQASTSGDYLRAYSNFSREPLVRLRNSEAWGAAKARCLDRAVLGYFTLTFAMLYGRRRYRSKSFAAPISSEWRHRLLPTACSARY